MVVVRKIGWKSKVSGLAVHVRRELAIIRFYVTITRSESIIDVAVRREVCLRQASRSSAEAVR